MAIALLTHTSAGSSPGIDSATTSSINTTGASLIIIEASNYAVNGLPTVTDNKGNTYTALTPRAGSVTRSTLYYCLAPTAGASHTFTITSTGGYPSLSVASFSGVDASALDQQNGANHSGVTSGAPGSVTPTTNNQLVITGIATQNSTISSVGGGFSILSTSDWNANQFGSSLAYVVQTTATASNPTWTMAGSSALSISIATFKAAPDDVIISQTTDGSLTDITGGTGSSSELAQQKAQSIVATTTSIRKVSLRLYKSNSPVDNIVVKLTSTLGGTALGTASMSAASVVTGTWYEFDFGSDAPTTPSSTYYIEVSRSGSRDTTNRIYLYFAYTTNPYAGGYLHVRHNNTWQTDSATSDFAMIVKRGTDILTLPIISNTSTLYSPAVSARISLPHISDADTLFAPTIKYKVTLPVIATVTSLYSPTVLRGAVSVALPVIASTTSLYSPTVLRGAVSLTLPTVSSTTILYSPTVSLGSVSLTLPAISSTTTLHSPTLSTAYALTLPLLSDADSLYSPTVSYASLTLILPIIPSASTIHAPTLMAGSVVALLPHILSTSSLLSFSLTQSSTLVAASLSSAPSLSTVSITQQSTLSPTSLSTTTSLSTVSLTQANTLAGVASLSVATSLGSSTLAVGAELSVNSLSVSTSLSTVSLVQQSTLVVNNLSISDSLSTVDLIQSHILAGLNALSVSTSLSTVTVTPIFILLVDDLSVSASLSILEIYPANIYPKPPNLIVSGYNPSIIPELVYPTLIAQPDNPTPIFVVKNETPVLVMEKAVVINLDEENWYGTELDIYGTELDLYGEYSHLSNIKPSPPIVG